MKNLKKLIAILSLSAIVLMACGSNDDTKDNVNENTEPTNTSVGDVVSDNTHDEENTDTEKRIISDLFVVHSNHRINMDYFRDVTRFEPEDFNQIQTLDQLDDNLEMIDSIRGDLLNAISNDLNQNPYSTNTNTIIDSLDLQTRPHNSIYQNVFDRGNTSVLIIDKQIDKYMADHPETAEHLYMSEKLRNYEENINTTSRVDELVITLFENDKFSVILSPSHHVLGFGETNDINDSITHLNQYAKYFQKDEVTAIFEQHLGQNTP